MTIHRVLTFQSVMKNYLLQNIESNSLLQNFLSFLSFKFHANKKPQKIGFDAWRTAPFCEIANQKIPPNIQIQYSTVQYIWARNYEEVQTLKVIWIFVFLLKLSPNGPKLSFYRPQWPKRPIWSRINIQQL